MEPTDRPRRADVLPIPASRRAVTSALRAGRRIAPVHGLLSVDITEARTRLSMLPEPLSITAFVVASVGRVAAAHPEVHAYQDWRRRLVIHQFVDIVAMVEVTSPSGSSFPMGHLIRDADIRDVADISAEIRRVKADPGTSPSGQMLQRTGGTVRRIPGAFALMYWLMARSRRVRRLAGTVSVTSVGMFAGGEGFGIGQPTVMTLGVLVGGISQRPRVVDGSVVVREMMDLTVTVDHNVVDGAPAARFVEDLRRFIETAKVLS